jgi:hypothetical protein
VQQWIPIIAFFAFLLGCFELPSGYVKIAIENGDL